MTYLEMALPLGDAFLLGVVDGAVGVEKGQVAAWCGQVGWEALMHCQEGTQEFLALLCVLLILCQKHVGYLWGSESASQSLKQ